MAILVSDSDVRPARDYVTLWLRLCGFGGPQPSRDNQRADEHANDRRYRVEVEGDVDKLP
jgi:hypothetical protein